VVWANSQFATVFFYLAIQRSVWRDIKFAVFFLFFLFVCTVEDISTQDGVIGVKFWLRVEQTAGLQGRERGSSGMIGPWGPLGRGVEFLLH